VQLEDRVFVRVVDPLGKYVGLDVAILMLAAQNMLAAIHAEQPTRVVH